MAGGDRQPLQSSVQEKAHPEWRNRVRQTHDRGGPLSDQKVSVSKITGDNRGGRFGGGSRIHEMVRYYRSGVWMAKKGKTRSQSARRDVIDATARIPVCVSTFPNRTGFPHNCRQSRQGLTAFKSPRPPAAPLTRVRIGSRYDPLWPRRPADWFNFGRSF